MYGRYAKCGGAPKVSDLRGGKGEERTGEAFTAATFVWLVPSLGVCPWPGVA